MAAIPGSLSAGEAVVNALCSALTAKSDAAIVGVASYCFSGSSTLSSVLKKSAEGTPIDDLIDGYIDARAADAEAICSIIASAGF